MSTEYKDVSSEGKVSKFNWRNTVWTFMFYGIKMTIYLKKQCMYFGNNGEMKRITVSMKTV
ncbi:hypothetical protein KR50_13370 [Jeotgalibacillus campisalis]|uniref:Uncharacterized protein n=1 Tax=Jeotgalibacillus campisalis TaxID=220754 RepID=A0A0C2S3N0_9BACL|nr:hypothetical protein KR50_13370 [Jeotgalibacillus campisalis]